MMCPKCGADTGSNRFCPKCGHDLGAQTANDGKFNVKDLLTRKNIEYVTAAAGVLPCALSLIKGIFGIFSEVPLLGTIFTVFSVLLTIVVILAEVGACAGIGMLIAKDGSLRSVSGYLAAGAAGVSLINVIIITATGGGNFGTFLLSLITLAAAADMVSRVLLQGMELSSSIDVGRDMGVYTDFIKQAVEESKRQKAEQQQIMAQAATDRAVSYFDGGGIELLGYMIITAILNAVTFSIASPWTTCMVVKWRKSHTVINGRRLAFTGTGGQLLGLYIKWVLLSIITLGIYAFFAYVDYLKWEAAHTFFDDENPAGGSVNPNSSFDGNTFEFIGYSILSGLITIFTLGIGFPWAYTMLMNWQMSHYVISGRRMSFDGKGLQFLGTCIICILLCLITFGIYSPWATIRLNKWLYSHTKEAIPAGYVQPDEQVRLPINQ